MKSSTRRAFLRRAAMGATAGGLGWVGCGRAETLAEENPPPPTGANAMPPKRAAAPFPLESVRLLDGPFREAMLRDLEYLLALDSDRLLHTFRRNAGLPSAARPLGGWEHPSCELRGHFIGHYLSACALMYAGTGDPRLKARANLLVEALAECQQALGPGGYLSAFPESHFDRLEAGAPVWAPWYVIHKIMAGLLDAQQHCHSEQAGDLVARMAAWVDRRTSPLGQAARHAMLEEEFGGMGEVLRNLYAVTGNPAHLAAARRFDHHPVLQPLAAGRDVLKGLHANTTIPKLLAAAREYELTGHVPSRDAARFFWHQVAGHRCYASGGTSNYEFWRTEPGHLESELSPHTQECCCSYNMLKLTRQLFGWTADPRMADYEQRTLLNSVLPAQDPETGGMTYFIPMASGYWKQFNTADGSFWCCTGTGVESYARLAEGAYFRDGAALYVNLPIASELAWAEQGVRIRQQTQFPERPETTLVFSTKEPVRLTVKFLVPWWAKQPLRVAVNGEPQAVEVGPSSYLALQRLWADGDRLEVVLPMSLHTEALPGDPDRQAVFYGPLLLAGQLSEKDRAMHRTSNWCFGTPLEAPYFVVSSDDPASWIRPVEGESLMFETVGQATNVRLVPFYKLFQGSYAVYWEVYQRGSDAHRAKLRRLASPPAGPETISRVDIGDETSETPHRLKSSRSKSGTFRGRAWRNASNGGWFEYRMTPQPDRPNTLVCTYWGDDTRRTFRIIVRGLMLPEQTIATQTLDHDRPGEFFDVRYSIPEELTRNQPQIMVRFAANAGDTAGGLFGCRIEAPPDSAAKATERSPHAEENPR